MHQCSYTQPRLKKWALSLQMINSRTTQKLLNLLVDTAVSICLSATLSELKSSQASTLSFIEQLSETNPHSSKQQTRMQKLICHRLINRWMTISRKTQIQVQVSTIENANQFFRCTSLPTLNCRCRGLRQSQFMVKTSFCRCEAISRRSSSRGRIQIR